MNRRILQLASIGFVIFGLALAFIPQLQEVVATTSTVTITGWNVPSGTQLNNGLIPLIVPMGFASFFAAIGLYFKRKGDFMVTLLLLGLAAGSTFGMLGSGGAGGSTANIALFQAILCWALFGVWVYQGAQGGGPIQE